MPYTTIPGTKVKMRPASEAIEEGLAQGQLWDPGDEAMGRAPALHRPESSLFTQLSPFLLPLGAAAGVGVAGLVGGGASAAGTAGPAAAGGVLPSAGISMPASTAPSVTGSASGGGGMWSSIAKGLGKVFGKGKLDPTLLALGGAQALLGGDDREFQSFKGTGTTDPVTALQKALAELDAFGTQLQHRPGVQMRAFQAPPQPIDIPGLGFSIGGGLGRDPAIADPTLLEYGGSNPNAVKRRVP